ncbi:MULTISPECIES: DNA translocase FtsK [unclassified Nitrospina]|uniref:DNA translocase FtsK n=1 Tax=unclassified Nitrospina TaxID=2638683 RepID=UPI003F97FE24
MSGTQNNKPESKILSQEAAASTRLHPLRDVFGVMLIGFTVFALYSLLTYTPKDPSLHSQVIQAVEVENNGGIVGAYLADLLVQTFGTGAFVFPLITFIVSWGLIRGREFSRWPAMLSFGFLFWVVLCGLLTMSFDPDPYFGHATVSGGVAGGYISSYLVLWLNAWGARLVLVTMMFIAIMGMVGVPMDTMIRGTGNLFRFAVRMALKGCTQLLALGGTLIALVQEGAKGLWRFLKMIRKTMRDNRPKLSEPVIVSSDAFVPNEIMTPISKQPEPSPTRSKKKKNEEPEEKSAFAMQEDFPFVHETGDYRVPPVDLLDEPVHIKNVEKLREEIMLNSTILERKLSDFGIAGKVVQVLPGPVITLYEYEPAPGVKVSRILSLTDDLALAMRAPSVRILAPVPGKSVVGIELPNPKRDTVPIKEIIQSDAFQNSPSKLTLAVGKDNIGVPMVQDLAQVPHLLIAGSTGSGKSVGINSMIISLLLNANPEEVKMIMIDPKMLELSMYDGIPHLIAPVVTNPKKAAAALQWAVAEMERRYKMMAEKGVRNITGYNELVAKLERQREEEERKNKKAKKKTAPVEEAFLEENMDENAETEKEAEPEVLQKLPYVVIIIDELADLMMVASKGVEDSLTRLAQMARAAGIHLIVATQRPSVDVLTGIIKANFPARISFQVTSRVDSRTILDSVGAEKLLGKGDMLFLPPGTSRLKRIHGCMVSDEEINRILKFIKDQPKEAELREDVFEEVVEAEKQRAEEEEEFDELYDDAVAIVAKEKQASISMLQRRLRVGYNRAARMIEIMEREGVVGPSDGIKPREVYVKPIPFD